MLRKAATKDFRRRLRMILQYVRLECLSSASLLVIHDRFGLLVFLTICVVVGLITILGLGLRSISLKLSPQRPVRWFVSNTSSRNEVRPTQTGSSTRFISVGSRGLDFRLSMTRHNSQSVQTRQRPKELLLDPRAVTKHL
jgi:hypothetical protein